MLIGADQVVHQEQQDDADKSDESDSSNSSTYMSVAIPNDGDAIPADAEATQPDQSRIWSTSTSDVPEALETISILTQTLMRMPLLAVAHAVLKHGEYH